MISSENARGGWEAGGDGWKSHCDSPRCSERVMIPQTCSPSPRSTCSGVSAPRPTATYPKLSGLFPAAARVISSITRTNASFVSTP